MKDGEFKKEREKMRQKERSEREKRSACECKARGFQSRGTSLRFAGSAIAVACLDSLILSRPNSRSS